MMLVVRMKKRGKLPTSGDEDGKSEVLNEGRDSVAGLEMGKWTENGWSHGVLS